VRDTSPVMAKSGRAGLLMAKLKSAVTMVTPAEGPSFGVAPSGTCKCNWWNQKRVYKEGEVEKAWGHLEDPRLGSDT